MSFLRWSVPFLWVLGLSSASFAATSRPASQASSQAQQRRWAWVDAKARSYVQSKGLPGMTLGVVEGNRLVWSKHYGYANQSTKKRATNKTLYKIGSISKVFTSMLLVSLRDAGKVRLDEPLTAFLPKGTKLPYDPRGLRTMTLRHLATHTSGLPSLPYNLTPNKRDPYNHYSARAMLSSLSGLALKYPIGGRYSYSNLGVALLGYALSKRANQSYEALLQERILRPLGMNQTTSLLASAKKGKLAVGYDRTLTGVPAQPWNLGVFAPAGSIVSSLKDLAKFLSFQFRAGQAHVKPVSGGSLLEMQSTHRSLGWFQNKYFNGAMGLGWHIFPLQKRKDRVIWHNGGVAGFRSFLGFSSNMKRGVIVLTNCGRSVDALGFSLMEELSKRHWVKPKLQVSPRLKGVVEQLKTHFVAKPKPSLGALFSPLFLKQIPLFQMQMMFAQLGSKFGQPKSVSYQPTGTPNLAMVTFGFAGGKSLTFALAIDSSLQGRIVMLYMRPTAPAPRFKPKKRPSKTKSSPSSRPATR